MMRVAWFTLASNNMFFRLYSLAPGRFQFNFRKVIVKLNLVNGGWGISYEIATRWIPQDLTDDLALMGMKIWEKIGRIITAS